LLIALRQAQGDALLVLVCVSFAIAKLTSSVAVAHTIVL